jgi:hypothetical protein
VLLKLAYLTLCRTIQLLALRGCGAAKDLDIRGDGRIMLRSGRN